MLVIAGLSPALHGRAAFILNELAPGENKLVTLPSTELDGPLYPEKLASAFVRALAGFAVRRRVNGPERPAAPSSIRLLYVPAPDDERLLRRLDFAVLPIPLRELAALDARGRQLRHSSDAIRAALTRALDSAGTARQSLSLIKERINRLGDGEPLLLPPRNFYLDQEMTIGSQFQAFLRGERPWTDRMAELHLRLFTRDNLPHLARGETRRAFQDGRNLVFLIAHPAAFHAVAREAEEDASETEMLLLLKGLYRFGVALPHGFHHDVQFEYGRRLAGIEFECGMTGRVRGHNSHANIYANDFVRMDGKTEI